MPYGRNGVIMPGVNSGGATKDFDFAPIQRDGDTIALAFSCGKDSLAAWLYCLENGLKVRPYYQIEVPGLQFVERSLQYYESFFGQHILRVLHPIFYNWQRTLVHQSPERAIAIDWIDLPNFEFSDVQRGVRRTIGIENAWIAVGTKRNDSLMRRMRIPPGGMNEAQHVFHPLVEWADRDVTEIIARHKVAVPVDYAIFGRSFDGVDYRFCAQVRDYFPEDWETIKRWFPLIEQELFRVEVAKRHGQQSWRTK
jgi:hypothetical protein